jgi:aspartate carbamoyltransferase
MSCLEQTVKNKEEVGMSTYAQVPPGEPGYARARAHPSDRFANGFYGQDILSVRQFSHDDLQYIFRVAEEMRSMVERFGSADLLQGKILANLFYEPSTRTSSSFSAAMQRLGGRVIAINEVVYSSVSKGESLPDTIRTLESYADVIVLRHPEVGSATVAAHYARKPIINAGDGVGEHPTQALLDLFTIQEELGQSDGLKVAMVGDLKYGRTVHSLTRLLCMYNAELYFISPDILRMPAEILEEAQQAGLHFTETQDIHNVIGDVDVLYVTRVQKERFADLAQYEAVKDYYVVDPDLMARAKQKMIVMHPLPRVGEISYAIDDDPRAAYFRQMVNGMYIRMALLAAVLGKA